MLPNSTAHCHIHTQTYICMKESEILIHVTKLQTSWLSLRNVGSHLHAARVCAFSDDNTIFQGTEFRKLLMLKLALVPHAGETLNLVE